MRFVLNGPDLPAALIQSQERGEVLFVCGAGVSRGAGLPLFRGLVEGVYGRLREDWNDDLAERAGMADDGPMAGQFDRVLRALERRLAAGHIGHGLAMRARIRTAVREQLQPPVDVDLGDHLALLELSRDAAGGIRILTTNFDTLFERAWRDASRDRLASHAGAAMPQPRTAGFNGVLHLHGRIGDEALNLEETDLVLTSAEFGDAYLRSGWASRYVSDLVRVYNLVLVGYQADDPPMRYLMEALEADRERYPDLKAVYAIAGFADGEEEMTSAQWRGKGIEPLLFNTSVRGFDPLYETLREWRDYASDPSAWRRARLTAPLSDSPGALEAGALEEVVGLLQHGDAREIVEALSPRRAGTRFCIRATSFIRRSIPAVGSASDSMIRR